jgi:hypothetical protein
MILAAPLRPTNKMRRGVLASGTRVAKAASFANTAGKAASGTPDAGKPGSFACGVLAPNGFSGIFYQPRGAALYTRG